MSDYKRDEFGRSRETNFRAEPSSSYRSHDSRPPTHHSNRSDRRGEDEPYYGPASHEKEDKNLYPGLVVKGEVTRIESYGAFVSFRDLQKHNHRGLVHISQLASYRVENVTDVLKRDQSVHAVVLEVEYDQRIGKRIRLSLKDVDQQTGKYTGREVFNGNKTGGGRRLPPRELERRAKSRRDTLNSLDRHWKGEESKHSSMAKNGRVSTDTSYLRKLWSSSPPRPGKQEEEPPLKKESRREKDSSDDSSVSTSSSSESSDSSSSESYESDRRRRRKGGRSRRSSKSRSRRSSRKRKRSSKSRSRRRRSRSSSSSSSSSSRSSSSSSSNESARREDKKRKLDPETTNADAESNALSDLKDSDLKEAEAFKNAVQGTNDEEDEEEGPMPLQQASNSGGGGTDENASYGKALLPGEGQALAQYVQQNLRIPRRGEIGYSGDDIGKWEGSGYVMSGSRHTRMNAVRIRKENQVYSAEEQRALALLTMEENQQKEAQLMEDFRTILKEKKKLREQGK
eukprot:CAMPEP_0116141234 /NCGR_PEP_ID=MMETSP0329-20121206/14272_1 /TAXON_ID=697910 /ORGANISM="Pseudo-nitzschia arenysensis, Strain B593" /LENGTH=511 /DNA_ID=CAMNT_0003636401 /DNA_START=50 /DNA_END=1585 /DNA_ORIENTATION=-